MNPADFRLLTYFVEIVNAGSIRAAAQRLSLSPAVVSTALRDLEAACGSTLIRRTTRSMALTEAGRLMHERALSAVASVQSAMTALDTEGAAVRGSLSITLPAELAVAWLPPVLRDFEAQYPNVRPVIHADDAQVMLARSEHDIALRAEFQTKALEGPDICACFPVVLVCAPEHAGAADAGLQSTLDRIGFVGTPTQAREGSLRALDNRTGDVAAISVSSRFVVNNQHVAQELSKQGFGAALLISASAERDLASGALVRIGEHLSFGYVAVRSIMRDPLPSPAAQAFRRFLTEHRN